MLQICLGLDHIHRAGMTHKDISADNILIFEDGTVKISSFGLAGSDTTAILFGVDQNYMSNENKEKQKTSIKSDIFSLGVLLLYLCNNDPLYNGKAISDCIL